MVSAGTSDTPEASVAPKMSEAFGKGVILTDVSPEAAAAAILQKINERHPCISPDVSRVSAVGFVSESPVQVVEIPITGTDTNPNPNTSPVSGAIILVSGGRGIGSAGYFDQLRELAALLGGEVASSRANVAAGWIPADRQVGQTSNHVAPEVYLALGISGTPQHLAGIHGARYVIAVNTDPDAPIFQTANFGVVGDLRTIVPALIKILVK
jgi:electron transfer flavoprotein alpha subunit